MSLKKRASRSIAIALVGVSVVTPILNSVSAMEPIKEIQNIEVKDGYKPMSLIKEDVQGETIKIYDQETRLGGGPSPSAAWTYQTTTTKTFTNSQLKTLNTKLQAAVKAGKKSQTAYNAATFMVGLMGWPGAGMSAYLTFCVQTQPGVIQDSANTVARALSKGGSVKLKVKKYIRPANGEVLCVYSGIS